MENINSTGMMSLVEQQIGDFGLDKYLADRQTDRTQVATEIVAARHRQAEAEAEASERVAKIARAIEDALNISPEYYDAA